MLLSAGYFPDHSSLRIWALHLEDFRQPITWFVYFSLFGRQQRKQTGKGVDADVFVLFGEAESSTFELEGVSDLVCVTGTLDSFDSDR